MDRNECIRILKDLLAQIENSHLPHQVSMMQKQS